MTPNALDGRKVDPAVNIQPDARQDFDTHAPLVGTTSPAGSAIQRYLDMAFDPGATHRPDNPLKLLPWWAAPAAGAAGLLALFVTVKALK